MKLLIPILLCLSTSTFAEQEINQKILLKLPNFVLEARVDAINIDNSITYTDIYLHKGTLKTRLSSSDFHYRDYRKRANGSVWLFTNKNNFLCNLLTKHSISGDSDLLNYTYDFGELTYAIDRKRDGSLNIESMYMSDRKPFLDKMTCSN
jgi:hypothetical protein